MRGAPVRQGANGSTTASASIASVAAAAADRNSGNWSSPRAKSVATPSTANVSRIAVEREPFVAAQLEHHRHQVDERHLEQQRCARGGADARRIVHRAAPHRPARVEREEQRPEQEQPQHLVRAGEDQRIAVVHGERAAATRARPRHERGSRRAAPTPRAPRARTAPSAPATRPTARAATRCSTGSRSTARSAARGRTPCRRSAPRDRSRDRRGRRAGAHRGRSAAPRGCAGRSRRPRHESVVARSRRAAARIARASAACARCRAGVFV